MSNLSNVFENLVLTTFGENPWVAYGKGVYRAKTGLTFFDNFPADNAGKDLAMMIIRPFDLALAGGLFMVTGLIKIALNITSALLGQGFNFECLALPLLGIAAFTFAIIAPITRLCNLSTRAYATLTETPPVQEESPQQAFAI